MLILIDRDNLKMVAAASKMSHMLLIEKHLFPDVSTEIVDSQDGKLWTVFTKEEMARLYTNMSGQEAPDYPVAIEQLRAYSAGWSEYPTSEGELAKLDDAQAIPGPLYPAEAYDDSPGNPLAGLPAEDRGYEPLDDEPYVAPTEELEPDEPVSRATHQAIISGVEAANQKQGVAKVEGGAPTKAKEPKEPKEPSAPRKPGATKRVWDIADAIYANRPAEVTPDYIKLVRKGVIVQCESEGINPGTAATQFGKWKAERGV
jgi:hypothetical protein